VTAWDDVDAYITDMLVGRELDYVLEASDAAGLPSIHVSPPQGKFLYLLARVMGARRILEFGTLAGYSTIWMARALPVDGELVTLEFDAKHAEVATANIERAGLSGVVDVRVGAALDTLPGVEGPFDLIFIDADKETYPEYFEWSLRLSRPGTVIVGDNVVRDGEVVNAASDDIRIQGVRRFNEMLAASDRVDATAIQTVGIKGYDGFAVALVGA
jgi:predicted O-methyltransferase YrrM